MKGILQEMRAIINAYRSSYETSLAIESAPGLAEVFDPAYEIPTDSLEKRIRYQDAQHILQTFDADCSKVS